MFPLLRRNVITNFRLPEDESPSIRPELTEQSDTIPTIPKFTVPLEIFTSDAVVTAVIEIHSLFGLHDDNNDDYVFNSSVDKRNIHCDSSFSLHVVFLPPTSGDGTNGITFSRTSQLLPALKTITFVAFLSPGQAQ